MNFYLTYSWLGQLAISAISDRCKQSDSALNVSCLFVFILVVPRYSVYVLLKVLLSENHNLGQTLKCWFQRQIRNWKIRDERSGKVSLYCADALIVSRASVSSNERNSDKKKKKKKGFNSPRKCAKLLKAKSLHMLKAQMMFHVKHYFYLYCFEHVGS